MPRPKKSPDLVMGTDIRIPVTDAQKELLRRAAATLGVDFTAWARPLLLKEAERVVGAGKKKTRQRSS